MQSKVIDSDFIFQENYKPKQGLSLDKCVEKAKEYIKQQGICLLLFDVCNSRNYSDRQKLSAQLQKMMAEINREFSEYFPINNLAVLVRQEKGFQCLLGDGSWAGINSEQVIPLIWKFQEENYPDIHLYWAVARDGFDNENLRIVR